MPKHFEYSLQFAAAPAEVFRVLTDTDRWRNSRVYGDIQWKGKPWAVGSTREVETLVPFHAHHEQRVLAVRQDEVLSVLSHGFGYTNHVQVILKLSPTGGTEVLYLVDIEGKLPLLFGFVIEEFVERFMEVYIPQLKSFCEEPAIKLSEQTPDGKS